MSPLTDLEIFQNVVSIAKDISQRMKQKLPTSTSTPPQPTRTNVQPLSLQVSPDLQLALRDSMLPKEISVLLINKLESRKQSYERRFLMSAQNSAMHDREELSYRRLFQARFKEIEERKVWKTLESMKERLDHRSRPPFKHEFRHVLEVFFKNTPYPSRLQKLELARRTRMSQAQVDTWFQNHRSRARREGINLTRSSVDTKVQNEFLSSNVSVCQSPPYLSDEDGSDKDYPQTTPILSDVLSPTCSPEPTSSATLLSTPERPRLPPPIWLRSPCPERPRQQVIPIDDLIIQFRTKLSLKDRKERRKTLTKESPGPRQNLPINPAPTPRIAKPLTHITEPMRELPIRRLRFSSKESAFAPYSKGRVLSLADVAPAVASAAMKRIPFRPTPRSAKAHYPLTFPSSIRPGPSPTLIAHA